MKQILGLKPIQAVVLMSLTMLPVFGGSAYAQARGGRLGAQRPAEPATETGNRMSLPNKSGRSGSQGKAATGANLSEQQKQNIAKLQADLNAIKQGSQVTPEQVTALKNDLLAMADGATKPDPALVNQLATDLAEALEDGNLSNKEKAQLSQDLYAVMNSANIPASEVNQAIADAQAILLASGVTKDEVQLVVNDLKAIAAEAQKNLPSGGGQLKGKRFSR